MLRPIFIHCKPNAGYDLRYDSLMMVNGSIAVLNFIACQSLGYPGLAIDETFFAPNIEGHEREFLLAYLRERIEMDLCKGDQPIVFCTLLSYNAGSSLALLKALKEEFGVRIRTGVGGQLVRTCPEAYLRNPLIDHVGAGDAEVVLADLLRGQRFAQGYKTVTPTDHYAQPLYENYLGLAERLDEMVRYQLGPFRKMRQLVTESVRGCAWAEAYRVCRFCSLQGIDTRPVFRAVSDHLRIERELAERYDLNWIFDASNQWLPTVNRLEIQMWLRGYLEQQKLAGGPTLNRYVYLTTNSITRHSAPLLHEAGVRIAYVGIDGWDKATRHALHKTQANSRQMLQTCAENDLFVRTGIVIGSGLSRQNLAALPVFVEGMLNEFGGRVILSIGTFLEIVLPGSLDWEEFARQAQTEGIHEAKDLYASFAANGYLTLAQEDRLNALRIQHTQHEVELEEVLAARDRTVEIVKRSPALSVTIRESERLERTT